MAEAPRRSTRRSKKPDSAYSVGDIVEISRNGEIVKGRLSYNLTEGPSPNPRWLVKFDGATWKDEELYEHSFVKVLRKAEDGDSSKASPKSTRKPKERRNSGTIKVKANAAGVLKSSSASSSEAEADEKQGKSKRKAVTFSESSPIGSEGESSTALGQIEDKKSALASAREQRSLRRQARIQDGGEVEAGTKRTRQGVTKDGTGPSENSKRLKGSNEEVVKIPMLTGTLYLYRGARRRAEFVRKF